MMVAVLAGLRRALVRDRDDSLRRRRPSDALRTVVAAALFALLAWHSHRYFGFEKRLNDFLQSFPDDAVTLARAAYGLLALWALGIVVVGVALARRWRLARDVAVAGVLAWMLGRLFAFFVHQTDLAHAFSVVLDPRAAPRFPLVRVELAVAVIAVAGPYLTRPTRWVGRVAIGFLAVIAMYLGRGFLTELAGALVLGWGVANLVKFAFGTPIGRPTLMQVTRAVRALAVPVGDVRPAADQPVGRAVFLGESTVDPGSTVRITALGRDEADAQFMARLGRYIAYRNAPPTLFPTRRQQVEYEAYVCLLAAAGGVSVPKTLLAADAGAVALLVQVDAPGAPLAQLDEHVVTDALVDEVWRQVGLLHAARITHGALDAHHFVVDGDCVAVVGWSHAATGVGARGADHDVAQLLAMTTAMVGEVRAVAAARRALPDERIRAALPFLQAAALPGPTREALDHGDGMEHHLEHLRDHAATVVDSDVPELRRLYRVHPRQLLMAVGALVGIAVLFSRVGDPAEFWASIRDANWWYVTLAFCLGLATDVAFAVAFLGTVPVRIPLWPAIELQSSLSFANLAVPVAADTAMQIRFLQKNGMDLSESVATGGILSSVSEIIIQLSLFGIALWLAPDSIEFGKIDTTQIVVVVLIAIFVVGVGAAVVMSVRRIRHVVIPPVVRALRAVWSAVKSPVRILLMLVGNIAAQCFYAGSLLACLHAFGASLDFWTLLALNIGISLIASLVPVPGGGTAVSAIGLSGMMVALGVPTAAATAAILAHQLAVSYLPAIPGWFASNDLVRKRLL
jgi:undecaprenyl-diphosphatase